jgi:hypothetical protein
MKIKKRNNKKRIALISALLAVLILMIFGLIKKDQILNLFNKALDNSSIINEVIIDNEPPTQEQIDAGEQQKEELNKPTNNNLGISITYIDTSALNYVSINSIISGAITNNGTCSLSLTKGDYVINKEASTYALPSSSTCMGFDIEKKELSNGTWKVELSVTVNDQTSTIFDEFILE